MDRGSLRVVACVVVLVGCGGPRAAESRSIGRQETTAPSVDLSGHGPEVLAAERVLREGDPAGARARVGTLVEGEHAGAAMLVGARALFDEGAPLLAATVLAEVGDVDPTLRLAAASWALHVARAEPLAMPELERAAARLERDERAMWLASLDPEGAEIARLALAYALHERSERDDALVLADDAESVEARLLAAQIRIAREELDRAEVDLRIVIDRGGRARAGSIARLLLGHLAVRRARDVGIGNPDSDRIAGEEAVRLALSAIATWAEIPDDDPLSGYARVLRARIAQRLVHPLRALDALGDLRPEALDVPDDAAWLRAAAEMTRCTPYEAILARYERELAAIASGADALDDALGAASSELDGAGLDQVIERWPDDHTPLGEHVRLAIAIERLPTAGVDALAFGGYQEVPYLDPREGRLSRALPRAARIVAESDRLRLAPTSVWPAQTAAIARSFARDGIAEDVRIWIGRAVDEGRTRSAPGEIVLETLRASIGSPCRPFAADGDLVRDGP